MNMLSRKITPLLLAAMACTAIGYAQSPQELDQIKKAMPRQATAKPKKQRKVLVFSLALKYKHSSIPYGEKAFQIMAEQTGAFTVDVTSDPTKLRAKNLQKYDAILFNNTTGDIITSGPIKRAFVEFVKSGKGVIGIHAATDTNYGWPEYGKIMGGYFDKHPWTADGTVTIKLDQPGHPLNKAFNGKSLTVNDEIYQFTDPYSRQQTSVLSSLDTEKTDMNKKDIKRTDGDFPISWVHNYGKGRVFYCSLGHNHDIFWNPVVLQHYLDGIQFALGDLDAPVTPVPMIKPAARAEETSAPATANVPATLEEALAGLKTYDFGQDRSFLITLDQSIRDYAGKDERLKKLANDLVDIAVDEKLKPAARELALRRLGLIGDGPQVDKIEKLLSDKNEQLAEMARITISAIPADRSDKALLKAAETARGKFLEGIIISLGKRQVKAAVAPLTAMAKGNDTRIASAAVLALGDIGTGEAGKALLDDIRPADAVREDWFHAMNDVAEALADKNAKLAERLYDRIMQLGDKSPARLAAFKGKALMDKHPEAVALKALDENDPGVGQVARELLVQGSDQSITPDLLQKLKSGTEEQKIVVVEILGARGDKSALPRIVELAESNAETPGIREAAIRALEHLGDEKIVPALLKVAGEQKGKLREAALAVLQEMPVPEVDAELLKAVAGNRPAEEQIAAIETIVVRKSENAVDPLIKSAARNDAKLSVAAYKALGEIAKDTDLAALLASVQNTDNERILKEAARAIAATAQKGKDKGAAVKAVAESFNGASNDNLRTALLGVLGTLGNEESFNIIKANLSSDKENVQDAAVRALADFPDPMAIDELLRISAEGKSEVHRVLALRGVARLLTQPSAKASAERVALLKTSLDAAKGAEEKKAIIGAAADMKLPGVLPLILPYLDQDEFKAETAAAIIKQAAVANQFNPAEAAELLNPLKAKLDNDQWNKLEEVLTPSEAGGGFLRAWQASPVQKGDDKASVHDLAAKQTEYETGGGEWTENLWAGRDEAEGDEKKGALDLHVNYPGAKACFIYLRTHVWSPEDRDARIDTGSDDGLMAWLNGEQIFAWQKSRGFVFAAEKTPVKLKRGWNTVMLKVVNGSKDWTSAARVVNRDGKPFADLKFSAAPQQ